MYVGHCGDTWCAQTGKLQELARSHPATKQRRRLLDLAENLSMDGLARLGLVYVTMCYCCVARSTRVKPHTFFTSNAANTSRRASTFSEIFHSAIEKMSLLVLFTVCLFSKLFSTNDLCFSAELYRHKSISVHIAAIYGALLVISCTEAIHIT